MANELTITLTASFLKGNMAAAASRAVSAKTITVTGNTCIQNIQTIGTAEEAILLGDVATPGYMFVKNMDGTNFVTIRAATGGANCVKLKAGEVALFRHAGTAPFAIADTGNVNIEYLLISD